jgi:hypothetical protein
MLFNVAVYQLRNWESNPDTAFSQHWAWLQLFGSPQVGKAAGCRKVMPCRAHEYRQWLADPDSFVLVACT